MKQSLLTIFNWYKQSEVFEKEALNLINPVKTKHKKMEFIRPILDKHKQIDLDSAFLFFDFLRPLYRELAAIQFYTAGRVGKVAGIQWSNIDYKKKFYSNTLASGVQVTKCLWSYGLSKKSRISFCLSY